MLDKAYDPKPVEEKWVSAWRKANLFRSSPGGADRGRFVVVIPPPNVTGALHLGHALNNTLQDVLVRWRRLQGEEACWVPGTDHGGIATQNVMEKQLKAEKRSRHGLGREKFLERMQAWTLECKKTILGQLERLGCALDWEREAFTMDEARGMAVFHAFKALWDKKLVYRGERMVNWCVRCGTALSDIEVEHEERKGHLWHIRYPEASGGRGLVVATTRPETMLGDTAVAVNPEDERYAALIGRALKLPLAGREIPVIADAHVDCAFGTGAVKVTPAHDPNDFEIRCRHPEIGSIKVIGPDGHMTAEAGALYEGLSREKAREKVLADLHDAHFLGKTEDYRHAVGVCYRCNSPIEPLLSWQWFVKTGELARPAMEALDSGAFKLHPPSWAKPYREWLANIKDWCVSRQIWWGHRIPVWYCSKCNDLSKGDFHQVANLRGVIVTQGKPGGPCPDCGSNSGEFEQDPDVLDTWFSSALWPLSVFGWPQESKDLKFYYPTSVLVTGYEILYLWVARMQMMGLFFTGRPPFKDAVIHGIVRDKSGKKMSKSLGNVVDPLVMMDKYGTDALRFSLIVQAHPGRDIPFAEDSLTGARNFANKLWNSTRFVLMNLPEPAASVGPAGAALGGLKPGSGWELADYWIISEFNRMRGEVEGAMGDQDLARAADGLYEFLWDKYCDWYIELAKARLLGPDGAGKDAAREILCGVLVDTLKLLHPFMPYITEELYRELKPHAGETAEFLLNARLPDQAGEGRGGLDPAPMKTVMEIVTAVRTLRAQLNVPPGLKLRVLWDGGSSQAAALVERHAPYLMSLARLEELRRAEGGRRPPHSATAVAAGMSFFVPLEGVIDFASERSRLEKDLAKAEAELKKIAQKVENKDFLSRAPEAEVSLARSQHEAALSRHSRIRETLEILSP